MGLYDIIADVLIILSLITFIIVFIGILLYKIQSKKLRERILSKQLSKVEKQFGYQKIIGGKYGMIPSFIDNQTEEIEDLYLVNNNNLNNSRARLIQKPIFQEVSFTEKPCEIEIE